MPDPLNGVWCYLQFCYLFNGIVIFFKDWPLLDSEAHIIHKQTYDQLNKGSKHPLQTIVSSKDYSIDFRPSVHTHTIAEFLKEISAPVLIWATYWRINKHFAIGYSGVFENVVGHMLTQVPEVEHFEATSTQSFSLTLVNRASMFRAPVSLSIVFKETRNILHCSDTMVMNRMEPTGKFNRIMYGKNKCGLGRAMNQRRQAILKLKGFGMKELTVGPHTRTIFR